MTDRENAQLPSVDNSGHFVLLVLVEIEDVAEFLTYRRNNFERWLLDNFSRFVLFVLVEIKDAVEFLTDRRHCRASLIIPAILFYSRLLEIEDVSEFLTYRRNIVERSW